jgi:hypothetical protein
MCQSVKLGCDACPVLGIESQACVVKVMSYGVGQGALPVPPDAVGAQGWEGLLDSTSPPLLNTGQRMGSST